MDFSVNSGDAFRAAESEYRRLGRKAMRRREGDEAREQPNPQEGLSPLARQVADVPDLNEAEARNLAYLVGRKLEDSPQLSLMEHPAAQKREAAALSAYETGEAVARGGKSLISEEARAQLGTLL